MSNTYWHNVRWNWDIAAEAVSTLLHIADELGDLRRQRTEMAHQVLVEAAGSYRDIFDQGMHDKLSTSVGLSNDCRALARLIQSRSVQAREAQAERERWRRAEERKQRERNNAPNQLV